MAARRAGAIFAVLACLLLLTQGQAAFAEGTWHQAYERSGPQDTCSSQVDETPWQDTYTGQREWTPSWAQWPNGGQGGWVCQRTIVWSRTLPPDALAPDVLPPYIGCVRWADTYGFWPGPLYYDFGYVPYLPTGSATFTDAACSSGLGVTSTGTAYASDATAALAICQEYGVGLGYVSVIARLNSVWSCIP